MTPPPTPFKHNFNPFNYVRTKFMSGAMKAPNDAKILVIDRIYVWARGRSIAVPGEPELAPALVWTEEMCCLGVADELRSQLLS